MIKEANNIAAEFGQRLLAAGMSLVTAESCTGGLLAARVTDIPGSSAWFDRAFITYTNRSKCEMLSVDETCIAEHGAVSEEVVKQMATGALAASAAQISIAVSGVAGPSGGSWEKPVGTVWLAWGYAGERVLTEQCFFCGDRQSIRQQTVEYAMRRVIEQLSK